MNNNIFLLSMDPGNNTGMAIFELDINFNILNISTAVVVLNLLDIKGDYELIERNKMLHDLCCNMAHTYNPHVVAIEAAFMNSRFPKAVMQLSQYTSTIEQAFYRHNSFTRLFKYPPKYVKKHIGAGGNADKHAMTNAVLNKQELSYLVDLSRLTEHEIDAIAIGYTALLEIRLYPHLLISY